MSSQKTQPDSEVRRQLELGREHVDYDVEAGLRRHRELVMQNAAAPSWATGAAVPRALWRARALSGLTVLVLGGAAWLAVRETRPATTGAAAEAGDAQTHVAPRERERETTAARASALAETEHASLSAAVPTQPAPGEAETPRRADAVRAAAKRIEKPRLEYRPSTPPSEVRALLPSADTSAVADVPPSHSAIATNAAANTARVSPAAAASPTSRVATEVALTEAAQIPSTRSVRSVSSPRAPVIVDERPEVVVEMQELSRAEGLLAKDPANALALVRTSIAKHPNGFLEQERRYVEVMAMLALRRVEEARLLGREFVRAYPQSPFRRRVDAAIAQAIRGQ